MRLFLYNALILSYFVYIFWETQALTYWIGILAILCILISFKGAARLHQAAGCIFLIVGLGLFWVLQKPLYDLPLYMTSTVTIMAIFYVLPFINSIIVVGRYDRNVSKLLKSKIVHLGQLYYRGSLVSFLLGTFLNIATFPLVESVMQKNLKNQSEKLKKIFISRLALRGYALSLVISPMEILVAMSIDMAKIEYLSFLPWLVSFAFILLLLDWLLGWKYRVYNLEKGNIEEEANLSKDTISKTLMLFVYLALFITTVVMANQWLQLGFIATVSLIIVPYSFLWALSIGRFRAYLSYSIPIWKKRTMGLNSYMFLFLSVSLFTSTLNQTHFINYIHDPVEKLAETPILLFAAIQVLFLLLGMMGFHPIVTMSILVGILHPLTAMVNPMSLALVLTTSGLSTAIAGPFNISVSLAGSLLQVNPYQISWWNLRYALLFSSIGSLMALWMM